MLNSRLHSMKSTLSALPYARMIIDSTAMMESHKKRVLHSERNILLCTDHACSVTITHWRKVPCKEMIAEALLVQERAPQRLEENHIQGCHHREEAAVARCC